MYGKKELFSFEKKQILTQQNSYFIQCEQF